MIVFINMIDYWIAPEIRVGNVITLSLKQWKLIYSAFFLSELLPRSFSSVRPTGNFLRLFIYSFTILFVCAICLSTFYCHPFVCLFIYSTIYLFVSTSDRLFVHSFIALLLCPSTYPSIQCLFGPPSISPLVYAPLNVITVRVLDNGKPKLSLNQNL